MKQPKRSDYPAGRDGGAQFAKAMSKYLASRINKNTKSKPTPMGKARRNKSVDAAVETAQKSTYTPRPRKPKADVNTKMYGSATAGMTKGSKLSPQQRANRQSAASNREMNPRSVKDVVKKAQPKSSPKPKQTSKDSSKPSAKPEKSNIKGYNPQLEKMRGGEMPKTKEQIAKAAARQAAFRKAKKSGAYTGSYSKFEPSRMAGSLPSMSSMA